MPNSRYSINLYACYTLAWISVFLLGGRILLTRRRHAVDDRYAY